MSMTREEARITTRREQVEKAWKGEWETTIDAGCEVYMCSACGARDVKELYEYENPRRFCYHCGASMTDEAVDMVMERIEKMKYIGIPNEFEDIFRGVELSGVELSEDEIRTLNWIIGWDRQTVENLRSIIQKAQAIALSTLQAENEELRAELCRELDAAKEAVQDVKDTL